MDLITIDKINQTLKKHNADPKEINSMASSIKELILYAASAEPPKHFSASDKDFIREDMAAAKSASDFLLDLAVAIEDQG